jgi:hypothetical protein
LSNLSAGTVPVTASKTGYSDGTTSVTVQSGKTVSAADITLSPVSTYGSVSGIIMDKSTSAFIENARVTAAGKTSYSDSRGRYSITGLSPGTVTVSVYAYEYANQDASVPITSGGTASKDFRLDKVTVSEFSDNFETDKGWTATGLWNRKDSPQAVKNSLAAGGYVTLPDAGYLPSANSGTCVYWFGSSDTGSYVGTQAGYDTPGSGGESDFLAVFKGNLTSPTISLSGYSTAALSFWTWWEIESRLISSVGTTFDLMEVEIYDSSIGTWETMGRLNPDYNTVHVHLPYSSGGYNKSGEWVKHQYDLTPYVGKSINIRFRFDALDVGSNGFRGWFIDDVSISKDAISPAWGR